MRTTRMRVVSGGWGGGGVDVQTWSWGGEGVDVQTWSRGGGG